MQKSIFQRIAVVGVFFALTFTATAQEILLPVSTTNSEAKALYEKAIPHIRNMEIREGVTLIDEAIALDSNFFMSYVYKAFMLSRVGADEKYIFELLNKAYSIENGLTPAEQIIHRAIGKYKEQKFQEGYAILPELITAYPNHAESYILNLDLVLPGGLTLEKRFALIDKLAKLMPEYGYVYNELGYAHMESGDMKAAEKAFKKYIKLEPNRPNPYDSMAEYYLKTEKYEKAAEYYDKAYAISKEEVHKTRADEASKKIK